MAITFYPRMGQVLVGDFSDLSPPEMTKIRPVIVVSPRLPHRSELVAIVPISTTEPSTLCLFAFDFQKIITPQNQTIFQHGRRLTWS